MNTKISSALLAVVAITGIITLNAFYAHASSFPALTLSSNGSTVQAIVSNGDPNATVMFFYPSGGSNTSVNVGTTDSNGYLTTQINPGSYNISTGNPVYVRVNQGQSPTATWPSVSGGTSGSGVALYLTQTTATLTVGQNVGITASNVVGSLSIPGNTNPSVASASVNGNVITVNGLANGTAALTVCASGSGCSTVNITVQPSYISSPAVYINPSSINLNVGQSQTATITGYATGPYYVQGNTGSNAVTAAVNNSNLVLTGLAAGNSNITVCASGGQCGTMFVNISSNGTTVANSAQQPGICGCPVGMVCFPAGSTAAIAGAAASATTVSQTSSCPAGMTCTPSASSSSSSGSYSFTRYLYIGMTPQGVSDPDVTALQNRLKADGLYSASVTGYFGPYTKSTVEAYQTKHGLSPIGVVGPGTRDLLNKGI